MRSKIRILIVEDEAIIAQFLKMELEGEGYEVCCFVASAEEAILESRHKKPDLVLMDIHLAGELDGVEAAKRITKEKNIPIIFMTGYSEKDLFDRVQELNPAGYLPKPIEIYDLTPVIDSIFNKKNPIK
jgi:two-component system, response regulator PdtaR